MRRFFSLLALCAFVMPTLVFAAQADVDVTITPGTPVFSPSEIYAGETIRIYANIMNVGKTDVAGEVGFYQGPNLLDTPRPFSLRANGASEDVWIDWVPVVGTYNILLKVETDRPDQNPTNNVYVTPMMAIIKRPPPPPPPAPVVTQKPQGLLPENPPRLVATTQKVGASQLPETKKQTLTSTAKEIAQKIIPSLTHVPPAPKESGKLPLSKPEDQKKIQSSPTAIAADESKALIVPVENGDARWGINGSAQALPDDPSSAFVKNEATKKEGDPARRIIALAVIMVAGCLGAGALFLKLSKT